MRLSGNGTVAGRPSAASSAAGPRRPPRRTRRPRPPRRPRRPRPPQLASGSLPPPRPPCRAGRRVPPPAHHRAGRRTPNPCPRQLAEHPGRARGPPTGGHAHSLSTPGGPANTPTRVHANSLSTLGLLDLRAFLNSLAASSWLCKAIGIGVRTRRRIGAGTASAGSEGAMSTEVPGEQGGVPRESAGSPEPGEVLRELAAVRRRTRSARHAYWFPLVLF